MEYLLFPAYLVLFAWLVTKLRFFTRSGLTNAQLVILLLLKIMAGIFYGWIGIYYGQFAYMFDTWAYHHLALAEYNLLFNNPGEYFSNLFETYYNGYGGFFASHNSYWNDLKSNFFIKIISVFDVFSFGNYYINVIFYSFITLLGPVAFYHVLNDVFPGKKIQVLLATFLIPSFLYWTSGIHKDGFVFAAISLIVYNFYFGIKEGKFTWKRWIVVFLSFIILVAFRNFILILLIPALTAWWISTRHPKKKIAIVFFATYLICGLLFFTLRYLYKGFDFPQAVVDKKQAFMKLQGNSGLPVYDLEPTIFSFIKNIPKAISLTTIRPHPGDVKHILSLAAASETNLLLLLFICFLIWRTNGIQSHQFIWFCLFFSFSFLLTLGYTVNFLGAIVRYRSIIIPFLVVPMVCLIDWKRISALLLNNMKTKDNI